jgi:hypothetical protein
MHGCRSARYFERLALSKLVSIIADTGSLLQEGGAKITRRRADKCVANISGSQEWLMNSIAGSYSSGESATRCSFSAI